MDYITRLDCALFAPYNPELTPYWNKVIYVSLRRQWPYPPSWGALAQEVEWKGKSSWHASQALRAVVTRARDFDYERFRDRRRGDARKSASINSALGYVRMWHIQNPMQSPGTLEKRQRRIKYLLMISPDVKCANCGCDIYDLLEVNHKAGGGGKESITYRLAGSNLQAQVMMGKRTTDDLEICCRVCNALHYIETIKGYRGYFTIAFQYPILQKA